MTMLFPLGDPGTDLSNWNIKRKLLLLEDLRLEESLWPTLGESLAKSSDQHSIHHCHLSEQVHHGNVNAHWAIWGC